jgi:type IV pilus assembly protein PilW
MNGDSMKTTNPFRRQSGFSIIEIMVGVVIGMIAVLVIYQVFATSEGIKRNITAAGDAQQNGLLSSFMMGIELANAGNGLAVAAQDLGTCTPAAAMKDSLRPIPLLVTAGANDNTPDSFVIYYSVARTLIAPALFTSAAAANSAYQVQSANGFKQGDLIVAITNPSGAGDCYSSRITAAVPAPDVNGIVTITHTGAPVGIGASATLFNLGPSNLVQKVQYDVSGGNLRSTSLLDSDGVPSTTQPVNPIASNVLNIKVQYGIDTVGDGLVHHWVPAISGTPYGDWDPATLLAAPVPTINRIKAARIAVLVRSEQHDKDLNPDPGFSRTVFNDCADGGTCYPVTFSVPAVAGQEYGWRYRVYETVIPLRNEVWNKEV